jgi:glycosyltransferase involved in cell wall biosynthesis
VTLHLLMPAPHAETTREWESCAYTARTRVLASMMARYGRVVLYGAEQNEAAVTEHVQVVDRAWQRHHFPTSKPGDVFNDFDPARPHWQEFNTLAAVQIRKRAQPGDILGITMGTSQQPIAGMVGVQMYAVEVGIGYTGVWAPHRVFESYAWQHFLANRNETDHVRYFDAVIPRAYEVGDFPAGDGRGGYFLFMGRVIRNKGPHIAAEVARRIGARLVVAGPGVASVEPGRITATDGTVLEGDVEYAGIVGPERRAELMGGAIATFTPTAYLGPFEGVHAESLLTGTPVVATDHGCFTEFVENGVNGYRARTLAEFIEGAQNAAGLDRVAIRRRAIARYGTEAVGPQMDAYLRRVNTLKGEGWYALPPERVAA